MNWKGNITIYCDCGFINMMHTKTQHALDTTAINCRRCGRVVTLKCSDYPVRAIEGFIAAVGSLK